MSDVCSNLSNCEVWKNFKTNSKFFWIKQYCEGPKQEICARAALGKKGLPVPSDLLPNGNKLS